jgi:hypothetical protein
MASITVINIIAKFSYDSNSIFFVGSILAGFKGGGNEPPLNYAEALSQTRNIGFRKLSWGAF